MSKQNKNNMTDYSPYNPDENTTKDHPWIVQTDGGFADSKEFYNEGEIDAIKGGDPTLRKHVKGLFEKGNEGYVARHTGIAAESVLAENEVSDPELEIDMKKIQSRIDKMEYQLDKNEELLKKIKNVLSEKKVNLNHLENLARELEKIKIPPVIPQYGNSKIDTEITDINNYREDQIGRAAIIQAELDAKLALRERRKESEREKLEKRITEKREMEKLASEMGGYLMERREAGEALDKITEEYKKSKKINWSERSRLNEDMYEASLGLMLLLRKLRDESPNKILKLIPALDQSVRGSFYPILRAFFRTHNTGITADEIKTYGEKSKNMNFAKELLKFAEKAPQEDEELSFYKDVTRLPEKVLEKLFHPVKEEAKEIRKAA